MNKKIFWGGLIFIALIAILTATIRFFNEKKETSIAEHKNSYVSESSFKNNLSNQMQSAPEVLQQLSNLGVSEDDELELEYFFYTNTEDKAKQLATEIKKLNYTVEHGPAAEAPNEFVITGWTTKMKMSDNTVVKWTKEMVELGYKFDCEFDGWGTNPTQNNINKR